jgi:hypothetical protein
MKANVHRTIQKIPIEVISDPKQVAAAETGELTHQGKSVLITKGGDTLKVCEQIYLRFSKEKDALGKPFVFSRRARGLAHSCPVFHNRVKVSGQQFEEYLARYFQFAEKVTTPAGDTLILTDKPGKFFSALMMQTRFMGTFLELFEMVD